MRALVRILVCLHLIYSCTGTNHKRSLLDNNLYSGLSAPLSVHFSYGNDGNSQYGGQPVAFNQVQLDHGLKNLNNGAYAINNYEANNQANLGLNYAANQANPMVNYAANQANPGVNYATNQANNGQTSPQNQPINFGDIVNHHITITRNLGVAPIQNQPQATTNNQIQIPLAIAGLPIQIDRPLPYAVNVPVAFPVNQINIPGPVSLPVNNLQYNYQLPAQPQYVTTISTQNQLKQLIAQLSQQSQPQTNVALGSGSLGYVHLGNGRYALGSGSIGVNQSPRQVMPQQNKQNVGPQKEKPKEEYEKKPMKGKGYYAHYEVSPIDDYTPGEVFDPENPIEEPQSFEAIVNRNNHIW